MIEIFFPIYLWLLGMTVTLPFYKVISPVFFAWTGFLTGSLVWLIGGIFYLVVRIDYTPLSMLIWSGIVMLISFYIYLRNDRVIIPKRDWIHIVFVLIGFIVFLLLILRLKMVSLSPDSFSQFIMAENLATNRLLDLTYTNYGLSQLGLWGIFLPMIHAVAFWFGDAFFITIQPAFTFSLVGVFYYVCQTSIKSQFRWLPALLTFLLASSFMIVYQTFYVHNSIFAAAYLFPAVALLWQGVTTKESRHIILSMFFFIGFVFSRTESLLFVVLFVVPAITSRAFSSRVWSRALLPYTVILVVWHLWLLLSVSPTTMILSPPLILILVLALLGMQFFPYMMNYRLFRRIRSLDKTMLTILLGLLILIIILQPAHMMPSGIYSIRNTMLDGIEWWGGIWYFAFIGIFLVRRGQIDYSNIFIVGIIGFFILTWLLGFPRIPYRLGIGDSANRMFTHIIPIILFYILLKIDSYDDIAMNDKG